MDHVESTMRIQVLAHSSQKTNSPLHLKRISSILPLRVTALLLTTSRTK